MLIKSTPYPIRGWNSYDSYGVYINEQQALANIDAFIEKLAPHGYEYFVLDACWYMDGTFLDSFHLHKENKERTQHIDEWGRFIESPELFPHGLRYLADRCHQGGIKFGLHLMRGLPALAIQRNTPIKGHPSAHARDIADMENLCAWPAPYMGCGINMNAPGAQKYYDSVVEYLANDVQVDFIKLDDVVESVDEVSAFSAAVDKVERPIVISLSPGQENLPLNWEFYKQHSNMVRITRDIWDIGEHNDLKFDRWYIFENCGNQECWIDLDMIPIGGMQVHVPEDTPEECYPVLKCRRRSDYTYEEKKVLMTQLALAASPLVYGGDLPMSNQEDIQFVTEPEMLACNANGVVGKCIYCQYHLDVRKTPKKEDPSHGWLGIFNRHVSIPRSTKFTPEDLGFTKENCPPEFYDIWNKKYWRWEDGILRIPTIGRGCVFLKY